MEDNSNVVHKAKDKPMQADDYQKIETELQKQIQGAQQSKKADNLVTTHLGEIFQTLCFSSQNTV